MEYNTTRDKLIISEYGRNIQKLVRYALTIEDRQKRTEYAKMIVQVMGQMNPNTTTAGDYRHKLWDHLHIISDFKLDVDSTYDPPSPDILATKPDKLKYKDVKIRYMMYGTNVEMIIDAAIKFEEGPEKDALVLAICNHLKKSYLNWNRESVSDELIFEHLKVLSKGKLQLRDDLKLNSTNEILARNRKTSPKNPKNVKHTKGKRGKVMKYRRPSK